MKKHLLFALGLFLLAAATAALSGDDLPPVGLASFAGFDHLWLYTGKAKSAMSSSSNPKGSNMDMWSFHGKYHGEPILAKVDGPGCIYRVWTAFATGRIKVYLDGSTRPEIDCGLKAYTKGQCKGLPGDFIAGHANYMPIPFAKSVIVTAPGFMFPAYYQVSYITYDPSVKVTTFKKSSVLSDPQLSPAKVLWTKSPGQLNQAGLRKDETSSEPGKAELSLAIKGTGVIRELVIKNPKNSADPLFGLRLKIKWDGSDKSAIDVPIDAFFMNQADLKDKWPGGSLKSMFISAGKDGYACAFPMPFAGGANISVSNIGRDQAVQIIARWEEFKELPANAMRFHALYAKKDYQPNEKKENIIKFTTPVNPDTNYVVLDIQGKGNFVGDAIFVKNIGNVWWGEGDEMDWVDGSSKPQIQGTGTEDEFNWGWGFKPKIAPVSGTLPVEEKCKESIVAQVIPAFRNPECQKILGDNIAFRLRPSDYVPFEKSIKVSYELLGNSFLTTHGLLSGNVSQERGDKYASIAYWYELP